MLYEVPAPNSYEIRILGQSRHIKKEPLFYKGVGEKERKTQIESSWPPGLFSYNLKELSFYSPQKFSRFIKWLLTYETITLGCRQFINMVDRL